jgi:hypothetical protein
MAESSDEVHLTAGFEEECERPGDSEIVFDRVEVELNSC